MKKIFLLIILLSIITAFSTVDNDFIQKTMKSFEEFHTKLTPTTIQIYFNQPAYFPGDTIFFSTRYTQVKSKELVKGRDIVNIVILNNKDSVLSWEKLSIIDGLGSHQFRIRSDITPGIYRCIAYTNWMQNLGNQSFFETELIIEGSNVLERVTQLPEYYVSTPTLINGVPNTITIDSRQNKPGITVTLLEHNGTSICSTLTDSLGLATLTLIPNIGEEYSIHIESKGKREITQPIRDGLTMSAVELADRTEIHIYRSKKYNLGVRNYFIAYSKHTIVQLRELIFPSDHDELKFYVERSDDLLSAQIIDELGVSHAGLHFINNIYIPQISMRLDKTEYSTRDSAIVTLHANDIQFGLGSGTFNVRVINSKVFNNTLKISRPTLTNLMFLKYSKSQINNWLATQQKQFLNWESILSDRKNPTFSRESYVHLTGLVKNKTNGKFVPDSTRIMLFFQNRAFGYEAYSKTGEFSIPILFDIEETDDIFISAKNKYETLNDIEVEFSQSKIPNFIKRNSTLFSFNKEINPSFQYHSLKSKVDDSFSYYSTSKKTLTKADEINSIIEDELGQPDYSLNMSNYLILPSMAEITKELLKSVEYRRTKTSERIRVYVTNYDPKKSGDPLFVIDGHLTKNPKHFLQLDPSTLLTIKLYRESSKLIRFGTLSSDGIIIVKTSKPSKVPLDTDTQFKGLLKKVKDVSMNPRKKDLDTPDLRPSLYWNSSIAISPPGESKFSFYTSDDVGAYIIQVTGFTAKGVHFSAQKEFTVTHKNK